MQTNQTNSHDIHFYSNPFQVAPRNDTTENSDDNTYAVECGALVLTSCLLNGEWRRLM